MKDFKVQMEFLAESINEQIESEKVWSLLCKADLTPDHFSNDFIVTDKFPIYNF